MCGIHELPHLHTPACFLSSLHKLEGSELASFLEDHQGVADDQPLAVEVYLLKLCSYLQLVCFGVFFVLPCYCDEGEIVKMLQ